MAIVSNTADEKIFTEPPKYQEFHSEQLLTHGRVEGQEDVILSIVDFFSEDKKISGSVHLVINLDPSDNIFNIILNNIYGV